MPVVGSPPLVRERQPACCRRVARPRITPTRAGKTRPWQHRPYCLQDHPRSCGKDRCQLVLSITQKGSPPLVRERPLRRQQTRAVHGITPARAGKTDFPLQCRLWPKDHPRSCGKDAIWKPASEIISGSPPLVRERLSLTFSMTLLKRITPARAGKTLFKHIYVGFTPDHPRSCGKDVYFYCIHVFGLGSPPLVRERP